MMSECSKRRLKVGGGKEVAVAERLTLKVWSVATGKWEVNKTNED